MTRLRVGLAGAGWVMEARHIPALRRCADVEIVALYDRQATRAELLARRTGLTGARVYSDLDEFVGAGLDVVSVATSPWSHHDIAIAALAHGAHVFTEKPMAMNVPEARAMLAAAASAGRVLCVCHNFRFSRSARRADEILAGDTVRYVGGLQLSSHRRRLPVWYRELPGGLLFDEMPHLLYMTNHLLGGGLRLGHGHGTVGPDGHPAITELQLVGQRGEGQITMVFDSPVSEWHLMVVADERIVVLDLFRDILLELRSDHSHRALDIARSSGSLVADHLAGFLSTGVRLARRRQFWGHDEILRLFIEAARGRAPVPVSAEEALSVVITASEIVGALQLRPANQG